MTAQNGDRGLHPSFFIERIPADKWLPRRISEFKAMIADGWDLVVLLDLNDGRQTLIAFGVKEP